LISGKTQLCKGYWLCFYYAALVLFLPGVHGTQKLEGE
jgi:hypothetical protein